MVRRFQKKRDGLFSKPYLIPTDEFELYQEYDGYAGRLDGAGICISLESAQSLRNHLLEPYYRQFKEEKIIE